MEKQRQQRRGAVARHGYKLLSDKSEELHRKLVVLIEANRQMRANLEAEIGKALEHFFESRQIMGKIEVENAILAEMDEDSANFTLIPANFDRAVSILRQNCEKILNLAELEKRCTMISQEIIKIRRRTNALEYVVIPEIEKNIKDVTMRLNENERGNIVRLMKIKSIKGR